MKKIIDRLLKVQEALEQEIEHREAVFSSRSEKWQESDKGMDYELKTENLSEMLHSINDFLYDNQD